jgi:hypothetical protein
MSDSGGSAAYEEGVERLAAAVANAVEGKSEWDARVAAGLGAGLELLAGDPLLARALVDATAGDGDARLDHERSLARLADALRPAAERSGGAPVSDELLRLQAHGLVSYLSGRVLAGETEKLPEAHGALLEYLLAFSGSPD